MNSIQIRDKVGKDITVNWKMYNDFDPQGEFWTDSNGLEMQRREIDQRDGYPFLGRHTQIARNYYPVDSAIAMRDKAGGKLQVTVMTSRAQGGSADLSDKATIELMQHRRLTQNDPKKEFAEALNETDANEQGISVNAEYVMQIFDFQSGKSKQREQQIRIDQPLQYFFAFDLPQLNETSNVELVQLGNYSEEPLKQGEQRLAQAVKRAYEAADGPARKASASSPKLASTPQAIPRTITIPKVDPRSGAHKEEAAAPAPGKPAEGEPKEPLDIAKGNSFTKNLNGFTYQAYPVGRNKILLRIENLLDRFDLTNSDTKFIDLINFSKEFWFQAQSAEGKGDHFPVPSIQEMTVDGTQKLSTLKSGVAADGALKPPTKWIGVDDANVTRTSVYSSPRDRNGFKGVALEPMRIRTFLLDYHQDSHRKVLDDKIIAKKIEAKKEDLVKELKAKQNELAKEPISNSTKPANATAPLKPELNLTAPTLEVKPAAAAPAAIKIKEAPAPKSSKAAAAKAAIDKILAAPMPSLKPTSVGTTLTP